MNFCERIKNLRNDNGLSQQEVADLLKIDRKTYNRLENGKHEAKLETAMILADFYNVSLDYIVGYTNTPRIIDKKPYIPKPKEKNEVDV